MSLYQIIERFQQTEESISKNLYRVFGLKYNKSVSTEEKNIDINLTSINDYYDIETISPIKGINYSSGYILNSNDNRFGEFSGMTFDEEGNIIFVSDRGAYLKSQISFQNGSIEDFSNSTIGMIKNNGEILDKNMQDIEEIAYYKGGVIISHEGANTLSFYNSTDFQHDSVVKLELPEYIKFSPKNEGIEAMTISQSGKILAIEESDESLHKASYWDGLSEIGKINDLHNFQYNSSKGFDVSGATFTDDGDLLVLERKYTKNILSEDYEIKLKLVSSSLLSNKDIVQGIELLSIINSLENKLSVADNFESVTTKTLENGHIGIFLLSDDNRATFQRTILLQFDTTKEILANLAEQNHLCDELRSKYQAAQRDHFYECNILGPGGYIEADGTDSCDGSEAEYNLIGKNFLDQCFNLGYE